MTSGEAITPSAVQAAAVLANLPLTDERAGAVAGLLAAWLPAAHTLNVRMQADDLHALMPATVFSQGPREEVGGE